MLFVSCMLTNVKCVQVKSIGIYNFFYRLSALHLVQVSVVKEVAQTWSPCSMFRLDQHRILTYQVQQTRFLIFLNTVNLNR